ncbi:MAG: phosphatase domain-containing putative toxin [Planctomycetota bacterium]
MFNFGWIKEGVLAGMGRPSPDAWTVLRAEGVGAVLTLTERPPPGDPAAVGLQVLHVPVTDFGTPSDEDLERCVTWIDAQVGEGRAVVVHCHAGVGRTGTVLAAYLTFSGMGPASAIAMVRRLRPGSIETSAQERLVLSYGTVLARRREERERES